jgi:hypothetical protein
MSYTPKVAYVVHVSRKHADGFHIEHFAVEVHIQVCLNRSCYYEDNASSNEDLVRIQVSGIGVVASLRQIAANRRKYAHMSRDKPSATIRSSK